MSTEEREMKTHTPRLAGLAWGVLAILATAFLASAALGQEKDKFKEIREYTGADGNPIKVVVADKKTESSIRLLVTKGTGTPEDLAKVNNYFQTQIYTMTLPEYVSQA